MEKSLRIFLATDYSEAVKTLNVTPFSLQKLLVQFLNSFMYLNPLWLIPLLRLILKKLTITPYNTRRKNSKTMWTSCFIP